METYFDSSKIASVVVSIVVSYFILIFRFQYISPVIEMIFEFNVTIWIFVEFGTSLLCIIVPVLAAWYLIKFKLRHLLWGLPIIFLLVLIYSPEGFYFIIPKGSWFLNPAEADWKYGIAISLMFFIIQSVAVCIAKGIQASLDT